jgi:zinc transport system substrate-binding protein
VNKHRGLLTIALAMLTFSIHGCRRTEAGRADDIRKTIVTSDTLLSGMIASLLPPESSNVIALLPPNQCPGHYDIKLSDIRKVKSADLVVALSDMPFINKAAVEESRLLLIDTEGRNWMTPDAHILGLKLLSKELSKRFPEERPAIELGRDRAIAETAAVADSLGEKLRHAGVAAAPVLAASMQKRQLEWMGLRVVGEYGRPEAMSAREIVRLSKIGRDNEAVMVVDNLQSGPDSGKGIAEALGVPHVVLSNFPLEKGYADTLSENVDAVLVAARSRK